MQNDIKAYELFWKLYNSNLQFKECIDKFMQNGLIRFFNDEEWNKIKSQNYVSFVPEIKEFIDMFILGYNIGDCVGASRQLSYSYNDVDIVSGILPILKGTLNAEKEGGHCWLETPEMVIDTTLMLVIDKTVKEQIGYIEEEKITVTQLQKSAFYQSRKELTNDRNLKRNFQ